MAGFNLGLVMRRWFGLGKPRGVQDGLAGGVFDLLGGVLNLWRSFGRPQDRSGRLRIVPASILPLPAAA
ncbi:MAG: hypothetical protein FJW35_10740 [Acidobacteria bacterium]|nr:hypothetical protein [Acidobacteriota bacterium]